VELSRNRRSEDLKQKKKEGDMGSGASDKNGEKDIALGKGMTSDQGLGRKLIGKKTHRLSLPPTPTHLKMLAAGHGAP